MLFKLMPQKKKKKKRERERKMKEPDSISMIMTASMNHPLSSKHHVINHDSMDINF